MSEDKNNLNVEEEQGNAPQQQSVEYTDATIRTATFCLDGTSAKRLTGKA